MKEKQPTIGLFLSIPMPKDQSDRISLRDENESVVKEFLLKNNIPVKFWGNGSYAFGDRCFWCERELFLELVKFYDPQEEDVWFLSLPYLAQSFGKGTVYVTGNGFADTLANDYVAALWDRRAKEDVNWSVIQQDFEGREFELKSELEIEQQRNQQLQGELDRAQQRQQQLENELWEMKVRNALEAAISVYAPCTWYLYGCGKIAERNIRFLEEMNIPIAAFIVSDGENKPEVFHSRPVIFLSEYRPSLDSAVLISVGQKLKDEVQQMLYQSGVFRAVLPDLDQPMKRIEAELAVVRANYENRDHEAYLMQLALDAAPYEYGIEHPRILSAENLLELLIETNDSLCRFGDVEFALMQMEDRPWFQKSDEKLARRLKEIFLSEEDGIHIAIPDIFGDLRKYKDTDAENIRHYLKDGERQRILDIVGMEREYFDAYVSRPYIMYKDKEYAKNIFALFKELWKGKNILFVEGEYVRSGVGNDLFAGTKSIQRILCPVKNAFDRYDEILSAVKENIDNVELVLMSLGPTATVLAYDVAHMGVQAIDLGQLDNEYMWYQMGASERIPIQGRAVPEIDGEHLNIENDDKGYQSQIVAKIGVK